MARPSKHPVEVKLKIVLLVLSGESTQAKAARRHGISETSIGKWKERALPRRDQDRAALARPARRRRADVPDGRRLPPALQRDRPARDAPRRPADRALRRAASPQPPTRPQRAHRHTPNTPKRADSLTRDKARADRPMRPSDYGSAGGCAPVVGPRGRAVRTEAARGREPTRPGKDRPSMSSRRRGDLERARLGRRHPRLPRLAGPVNKRQPPNSSTAVGPPTNVAVNVVRKTLLLLVQAVAGSRI